MDEQEEQREPEEDQEQQAAFNFDADSQDELQSDLSESQVEFTPEELGLPPKFQVWRPNQWSAITNAIDDLQQRGVVVNCSPVGTGKSVTYVALALLLGYRVCVLTSTKGLQDQLLDDFGGIGLVDIRGRANYACHMAEGLTCEDGGHAKCAYGQRHEFMGCTCPYRKARDKMLAAKLVVTNPAYFMLANMYGEGLGEFDLLVIDEAHEAPAEITSLMSVGISGHECYNMLHTRWPDDADDASINTWRYWSQAMLPRAMQELEVVGQAIALRGGVPDSDLLRKSRGWKALTHKLTTLAGAHGPWASERRRAEREDRDAGYLIEPLWPGEYRDKLFCGIPRVYLTSATITRYTMHLLGLDPQDYIFREYPFIFPIRRCPVYFIPTVGLNYDSTWEDYDDLYKRMGEIVYPRTDRKGIIHSVSYKLRDKIMKDTSFSQWCLSHERNSDSTTEEVRNFKHALPPALFVSPSVDTGWDFPGRVAEYQIIPKLPFPAVKGSRIMEARCLKKKGGDPKYRDHLMIMRLVQSCGRIMRSEFDQGETFVLDNNMQWVWNSCRNEFPGWFRRLYQRRSTVPQPPPPLSKQLSQGMESGA